MERPVTSKSRGICRYYRTPRGCFAGDNCKFKHGEHEKLTPYDKSKPCRYFAAGYCKRGDKCWFKHVTPSNPPADPGESLICAICMEEPVTFGLLVDCSHVFCIGCIRSWRGQETITDDLSLSYVHKKCPYCRTPSKFVIPSSHFYPSGHPGKASIIERYKESLQRIPCKYFTASNPDRRYCPFGRDCMYQHLNEDGTPYIFSRGVDHYMPQRERRLRGIIHEVMTRSVFEYYHDFWIGSPDPSEGELPGELVLGEESDLEEGDTGSDDGVYLALNRVLAGLNPNLDTPPSVVTIPPDSPVPESINILTSPNAQPSDTAPHSTLSSPSSTSSLPSLLDSSECGTEDGITDRSTLSDTLHDNRRSQPIYEHTISSDRIQSPPDTPVSSVRFPQRGACRDTGTPVSTSPVLSQIDSVESQPLSSQGPPLEISSMFEAGATASSPPTRDPLPGEGSDTRQQEPPFMTDGRGRVVWSRSGVKRGSSPLSPRGQERTPNAAGDRD